MEVTEFEFRSLTAFVRDLFVYAQLHIYAFA